MQTEARTFTTLTEWVLRLRWLLLALVVALSAFFASQLPNLQLDNSNEQWLVEGDDSLRRINKFNDLFGNDDFVYILFDSGEFFRPEPIRRLGALAGALEAQVPHVLDVTWLGNVEYVEGRADSIEIGDLIPTVPEDSAELARLRRRALAEPIYRDNLISRDARTAGLFLEMDAYPGDGIDPRKDVTPAVREVLSRPQHADLDLVAVGGPLLDYDLDVVTATEAQRLGWYCLAVQVAILLWVGRGARAVIVPVAVVVMGIVWTFGFISLAGYRLNFSVIMVPVLLICVGIGDSMHLIAEFNDQRRRGRARRDAIVQTMVTVGWPCVLTSITTAVGFLSFLAGSIQPFRQMGIYAAAGVVLALLLSFVLVPIFYSFGRAEDVARRAAAPRKADLFDRLLGGTARLVAARPGTLVAVFVVLTVVSLVGVARVQVETNPLEMFTERVPIRHAFEYVDARMGGSMSVEIMLDTGERDGALDPGFIEKLDRLDRFLLEDELTTNTRSVLDVFRQMRRAFHENRPEYYAIPASRAEASQYLLLYEMSGGGEKEKLLSFDNQVARVSVRMRSVGTQEVSRFLGSVEDWAAEHLGESAQVEFAGMMGWAVRMTELVTQGQRQSFAAACLSITLLMMVVLRSVRLGLISMIPNVFPVLITIGLLGLTGTQIDLIMVGFSALIIGVAVDDTIHFFVRYRREFERLGRYAPAVEATLTSVGRPITFTTMTLSLGFGVLAASSMSGLISFGILSAFAFVWALLADFLFAPALLLLLRPQGPERPAATG